MGNLDTSNLKGAIECTTDGSVTVCELRGHYSDIISLIGYVVYGLHEETNVALEEIGKDLNLIVKIIKEKREEEEHD